MNSETLNVTRRTLGFAHKPVKPSSSLNAVVSKHQHEDVMHFTSLRDTQVDFHVMFLSVGMIKSSHSAALVFTEAMNDRGISTNAYRLNGPLSQRWKH